MTTVYTNGEADIAEKVSLLLITVAISQEGEKERGWYKMKQNQSSTQLHREKTKKLVTIPMLAAVGFLLYYLEFNVPGFPSFLKLDFSTVPAVIGGLVFGPAAGILIEVLKNGLHLLLKNTDGFIIGEIANTLAGGCFVFLAVYTQRLFKSKKGFMLGLAGGTLVMTVVMALANYILLLPGYAMLYSISMDELLAMFNMKSVWSLIMIGIVPFNLVKGFLLAMITYPVFIKLSPRLGLVNSSAMLNNKTVTS
ncbi:ECF transporter S component [Brevibacillus daliensis]|uniref:ECF transporter S component n=1 Tax=Brevibacillus daliensis TaxID=2892995 RepID=UPI001E3892B0|nr:ECF transporter S component [Brevibacillus daliensis]